MGISDRRLIVKRVDEVGFTSDSKCMEVKCRENNAEMVYMKGELLSSVLLMDSTGMGVGVRSLLS